MPQVWSPGPTWQKDITNSQKLSSYFQEYKINEQNEKKKKKTSFAPVTVMTGVKAELPRSFLVLAPTKEQGWGENWRLEYMRDQGHPTGDTWANYGWAIKWGGSFSVGQTRLEKQRETKAYYSLQLWGCSVVKPLLKEKVVFDCLLGQDFKWSGLEPHLDPDDGSNRVMFYYLLI